MSRWNQIIACLALAGCVGGSETGNPALPTPVALTVRSSDPAAVAVLSGGKITVIEQAWVAFGQPAWLPDGQCGLLDSYPHEGPASIVADLVAPDVGITVDVEPDAYCGMVVPLETMNADLDASAPAELADHSIVLRGHAPDGTPFTLAFPELDELELQAMDDTFTVTDETALLLAFDVATWMQGVDFGSAAVEDGEILIDETHNVDLLRVFEANIDCSLDLYADRNADGALDDGDTHIARCAEN